MGFQTEVSGSRLVALYLKANGEILDGSGWS